LIELLLAALNRGVLPEIPSEGSVARAVIWFPLAHMAGLLVGIGHAQFEGQRLPAADALASGRTDSRSAAMQRRARLGEWHVVMTGLAALATYEAARFAPLDGVADRLPVSGARRRNPNVLCEQAQKARGFRGQALVARRISASLRTHPDLRGALTSISGARIPSPSTPAPRFRTHTRCVAHRKFLGAFQEAFWHVRTSCDSRTQRQHGQSAHFSGHRHGHSLRQFLRPANRHGQRLPAHGLIKIALLADRQIERLVNWRYSRGLPPSGGGKPGLNSGFAGAQTARYFIGGRSATAGHARVHPDHLHQCQQSGCREHGLHRRER